jgi:hypothetical protein
LKSSNNPGARGWKEKLAGRVSRWAADISGGAVYKRRVLFLEDPTWRQRYERQLQADRREGKPRHRGLDNRFTLVKFAESVAGLRGSTAECGAYRGVGSSLICEALSESYAGDEKHFAFDAFQGLPEPGESDREGWWSKGDLIADQSIAEELCAPYDFCEFAAGWIPDRFPVVGDRRFRLVHIDVDLYDPTRASIDFFFPRLVEGGVMLLDDHGVTSCPGARKAAEEYFDERPERLIELPTGQAFIIRGADKTR